MVGYYVQASKWSDMGSQTIYISVQSAAFQLFSKIKDDNERLVRAFRKTIRFTSFLVFPILLGAILVAKLLIIILLTEKWLASVELFKWLCLGGILTAFTSLNYIFLQIKGRTDIILKLEAIKAAIAILVLALTLNAGILVITIAQVALRLLFMLVTLKVSGKQVNYPLLLQLKDMTPYLIISMGMLLIAYPFQYLFTNDLAILAVQVIVAVTFYLFINHIMKSNVLQDIWLFLTKRSI
jgi:O-antigen/teichoic acid export membrane protein